MARLHPILALIGLVSVAAPAHAARTPQTDTVADVPILAHLVAPGREADARAARIAYRLATAGRARCSVTEPVTGLVLQHLTQFEQSDRKGVIATLPLDRGPGVIIVVPDSPAAIAGVQAGDLLLAIDGATLPPEPGTDAPFDASRARARADAIHDLLTRAGTDSFALTLLRGGSTVSLEISPLPACHSRVHLARSSQRNAYADGQHVLLTTGLLAQLRGDDELAFVIAHEMAHNVLRHAAIMRGGTVKRGLGRMLGRSGNIVRMTEREADRLGGELMIDAGFDPVLGAALLQRIGPGIDLLSGHDSPQKRIAAMRALVAAHAR